MACGKIKIENEIWLVVGPGKSGPDTVELLDVSNLSQGWGEKF